MLDLKFQDKGFLAAEEQPAPEAPGQGGHGLLGQRGPHLELQTGPVCAQAEVLTYAESQVTVRIAVDPEGVETAAMGVDVVDIDADGRLDLYVTNMVFEFNNLYHNLGGLLFEDITKSVGLDKDNFRHVGWATRFVDFNHDGHLDCFVAKFYSLKITGRSILRRQRTHVMQLLEQLNV